MAERTERRPGGVAYRAVVRGHCGRRITETFPTIADARAWRDSTRLHGPIVGLQRAFYGKDAPTNRGGEGNG